MEGEYGMTREEEIIEAGIDYTMSVCPMCVDGLAFEEEIRHMNRNKSFEEGAKWADKTMIARAVKWLQDSVYDRYIEMHEDNIEDFRKEMKGE